MRLLASLAIDFRSEHSPNRFEPLFRTGSLRPHPACAIHPVGDLRGIPHALTAAPSLAAHRFSRLGNSDRIPSLAVPVDFAGELARRQGWRAALSGRFSAALSGQAGLPGHFGYGSDRGGSNRLRDEPGVLRKTGMAHDSERGIAGVNGHFSLREMKQDPRCHQGSRPVLEGYRDFRRRLEL